MELIVSLAVWLGILFFPKKYFFLVFLAYVRVAAHEVTGAF